MFGQQQKLALCSVTFGCVIATAPTLREQFAARLRAVCIDKGLPERGMQTQLAKKFDVSQQAARKWLDGASYPEIETIVRLADWGDVNVNWLLQGAGPMRGNRVDTKALVLDEAIRRLPAELGIDLIDNLRAKLARVNKLTAHEPLKRYLAMLDAYDAEINNNRR